MPLSVALVIPLFLVLLAVRRKAEARRLARLYRAQERWAADRDRAPWPAA
jgi:hypothetical protein